MEKVKATKQATITEEVRPRGFTLPNRKVLVKPIIKPSAFIPDTNHLAAFLAPSAQNRYVVPVTRNGDFVNILTNEEKTYLESDESGTGFKTNDLSVYKKENNFWQTFEIRLNKETLELDLSDPMDYIQYKVMLALKDYFCTDSDRQNTKNSYKYLIIDSAEEVIKKSNLADLKMEAYIKFSEIKGSKTKMINFIKVMGKAVAPNSTDDFLRTEIANLIESKDGAEKFLKIMNDPHFDYKVTFRDGIRSGAIIKRDGVFYTKNSIELGRNEEQVLYFLSDPMNQEIYIDIESKIKQ